MTVEGNGGVPGPVPQPQPWSWAMDNMDMVPNSHAGPHRQHHTSHCSCTKLCYLHGHIHVTFMVAETSITSPTRAHSRRPADRPVTLKSLGM